VKELINDIFKSMASNRQRIWLTGFAVFWGIFILIVLLGAGNGISRGVTKSYLRECDNVIFITPGATSMGYGSFIKNQRVVFKYEDAEHIRELLPDNINRAFPEICIQARLNNFSNNYCNRTVWGEIPGYICTLDQHIEFGRDLSPADEEKCRKVCVISRNTANLLFGTARDAVGKTVRINETAFKVIGVYTTNRTYVVNNNVYTPLSSLKETFIHKDELNSICFKLKGIKNDQQNKAFTQNLRASVSKLKNCHPEDAKAFRIINTYSDSLILKNMMDGLNFFIWFIGIATLISGIVGISNIMSITVRERTREFGIMRAMGARPKYIFSLVLLEAVMIAMIFGCLGMMLGIGVTQLLASALSNAEASADNIMSDPTLGLGLVSVVMAVIVFSGLTAGFVPARKSVKMKLIDAMNAVQ